MKRIFVCSPFQGKQENLDRAKKYCKYVIDCGHIPFAPHLIYPQFLSDVTQRDLGIDCGLSFLEVCDELWHFRPEEMERTDGMHREVYHAAKREIPIEYFVESVHGEVIHV